MTLRCLVDGCRRKRVGYTSWCYEHAQQIIEGRIRRPLADTLAALGYWPTPGRSVDPTPFPRIRLWRIKGTRR